MKDKDDSKDKPKRAFTGLAGRDTTPKAESPRQSMAEIIDIRQRRDELIAELQAESRQPDDDNPIVKTTRARGSHGPAVFQKYQFRLRVTGDRNARWDKGMPPHIFESMAASSQEHESRLDPENDPEESQGVGAPVVKVGDEYTPVGEHLDEHIINATANPSESIAMSYANVAQSMPRGFSVGVLSASFDYVNTPRNPTPETAWVFEEHRFKLFITRLITDADVEAVADRNLKNRYWSGVAAKKFARALKCFIALYSHFRIGLSDKAFIEDVSLDHQHFWTSTEALKRFRARVVQEGTELYGIPAKPKYIPFEHDAERTKRVWPVFMKVFRALPYSLSRQQDT